MERNIKIKPKKETDTERTPPRRGIFIEFASQNFKFVQREYFSNHV